MPAPTTGTGADIRQKIATADGSWVIGPRSHATFKYTHFANLSLGLPDNIANVSINTTPGTRLDIANLDTLGRVTVPVPVTGATAFNQFVQPIINRYGYVSNGVPTGGGTVGFGSQFNDEDFYRDAGQVGYNLVVGSAVTHELHFGYQIYLDAEDLTRSSNGWGEISVPGGRLTPIAGTGQSAFYTARFQQQTGGAASIDPLEIRIAEHRSQRHDPVEELDVQCRPAGEQRHALRAGPARGRRPRCPASSRRREHKYNMYEIPFSKMLQPRLGATWAYNGNDTIFGSYAAYNPAASSLPRAASWDRNLIGTFIDAHFDANGVLFAMVPVGSSSGKLFVRT